MRFADKTALVTGAASGIGAAVAALVEAEGGRVWSADLSAIDRGNVLRLDVRSDESWREVIDRIGPLDILVNAAGIARAGSAGQAVEDVTIADWRQVFAVNVEGTLLGCQHAVRVMGRRGGVIVNVASTAAVAPSPALAAYGASKAAVVQLTRSVAAACGAKGLPIRCNTVLPGMAETPMTSGMTDEYRAAWMDQIPMRRFASAAEVAHAVAFLASADSSYMTGSQLPVDGGLLSRPIIPTDFRRNP